MRGLLSFICILLCTSSALAQTSQDQIDQQANQVFMSVMSPYCPGRLLSNCPSSAATELKNKIKDSLKDGASPETLIEDLVMQFGPQSRAAPSNTGFGLLAWLVPLIFLALGAFFIYFWLRANQGRTVDTEEESL